MSRRTACTLLGAFALLCAACAGIVGTAGKTPTTPGTKPPAADGRAGTEKTRVARLAAHAFWKKPQTPESFEKIVEKIEAMRGRQVAIIDDQGEIQIIDGTAGAFDDLLGAGIYAEQLYFDMRKYSKTPPRGEILDFLEPRMDKIAFRRPKDG
jgi:hypothetical protein